MQNLLGNWSTLNAYQRGNLTFSALTLTSATIDRGFTGRRQMDGVNLIHMGGRVYDAEIGRFLSADPFVRDITNLQALNRYTYVENNPLSYTDPSGYFLKKLVKGIDRAVKSVVSASVKFERDMRRKVLRAVGSVEGLATIVSIALNFIPGCQGWCMMLVQAAHSAAMTDANGGTISQALTAGAIAFARAGLQQVGGGTNFGSNDGGQMVFQLDTAAKSVGLDSAGSLSKELAISVGVARLQVAEQKAQAKQDTLAGKKDDLFGTESLRKHVKAKVPTIIAGGTVELDPVFISGSYKYGTLIQTDIANMKVQACAVTVSCGGLGAGPYVGGTLDLDLSLQPIVKPGDVMQDGGWVFHAGKMGSVGGRISTGAKGKINGLGARVGVGYGIHGGYQGCEIQVQSCAGNF